MLTPACHWDHHFKVIQQPSHHTKPQLQSHQLLYSKPFYEL